MKSHDPPPENLGWIVGFLETFDHPVTAFENDELDDGLRVRIEALARGELSPDERKELLPLLNGSGAALAYLAERLKSPTQDPRDT